MSLDITIKFKEPKKLNYNDTHAACGSTMAMVSDAYAEESDEWHTNITHNMTSMAQEVPVFYHNKGEEWSTTLYAIVWRADEIQADNTTCVGEALIGAIKYMVEHRKELLKFNPKNGWGNYDSFLLWLIIYKEMCEDNPDCKILLSR